MTNLLLITSLLLAPLPAKINKQSSISQGAGAAKLIKKSLVVKPIARTNYFTWNYGVTNPSDYFWNLEQKIGTNNWIVIKSNTTDWSDVKIQKTNPFTQFRLHGRAQE